MKSSGPYLLLLSNPPLPMQTGLVLCTVARSNGPGRAVCVGGSRGECDVWAACVYVCEGRGGGGAAGTHRVRLIHSTSTVVVG